MPCFAVATAFCLLLRVYFDGKLILGGHSKGGNLAVYAAAFSKAEIRDRIITIYDGKITGEMSRRDIKTEEELQNAIQKNS